MTSLQACFYDVLTVNMSTKDTLMHVCLANVLSKHYTILGVLK